MGKLSHGNQLLQVNFKPQALPSAFLSPYLPVDVVDEEVEGGVGADVEVRHAHDDVADAAQHAVLRRHAPHLDMDGNQPLRCSLTAPLNST